ncbi:MAG TPA: hypothetical protein PLH72_18005 [Vicinamibacterales bacterium]|nr:hypothetical protein [Vicinamibacterales bacterium]
MKIVVSWSSGKDSAWMLRGLRQRHPGAVQALLTTTNEDYERRMGAEVTSLADDGFVYCDLSGSTSGPA